MNDVASRFAAKVFNLSAMRQRLPKDTYREMLRCIQGAQRLDLRIANIAFKEGMGTIDEVLAAQTAWLKANSEKIDAEINVQLSHEYLNKVMGTMNY